MSELLIKVDVVGGNMLVFLLLGAGLVAGAVLDQVLDLLVDEPFKLLLLIG